MANDYSGMRNQIAGDLNAAATAASLSGGGGSKTIKLRESDCPKVVPGNCKITVKSTAFAKLAMGDIICVSLDGKPTIRRFVRLKMTQNDTFLITAYEGFDKKQALPKSSLMGKVTQVEAGGRTWDPGNENLVTKFWNKLTEFGTHKPFGLG